MSSCTIDLHWGESGLSLYSSNELTFLMRRITPICVASTSVNVISQTPWNTAWGFALKLTRCSGALLKSCLTGSNWYGCILVGLLGKVSVSSSELELAILQWPPEWRSRHMVTWFGRHSDAFGTTENAFFSCIYNPQITVSPTSSLSASFNGNRVKNHP